MNIYIYIYILNLVEFVYHTVYIIINYSKITIMINTNIHDDIIIRVFTQTLHMFAGQHTLI